LGFGISAKKYSLMPQENSRMAPLGKTMAEAPDDVTTNITLDFIGISSEANFFENSWMVQIL
jgi:hypothetical protein